MSELSDLYQEVILDHNKSPRNYRKCENCNHDAEGYNPLCGDHIFIYIDLEDDKIKDISFQGSGCAISKSSASLMTTILKGKTKKEAEELFSKFHEVVTSKIGSEQDLSNLGKLAVFSGVRDYPARVKCASLAWHTMLNALKDEKNLSSTE
ncbi:MAG: SUF system NifU family Fe-S cluster assembly protein [Bacteroidota bacterium]|jgi:nitrogen fixation NifU-like protein|nr:SUF system NifU family Fe-S cluster assembly protein [Bacteroidota bacterium]MDP4191144.1 SUF system NifU family Fe-S cluster assembly protein [Bacteroidota bacterium]MDP4194925.1 SUF system NifU family Fe-S cluster assembly protein [Bacteroidota bacterium]